MRNISQALWLLAHLRDDLGCTVRIGDDDKLKIGRKKPTKEEEEAFLKYPDLVQLLEAARSEVRLKVAAVEEEIISLLKQEERDGYFF